MMAMTTSSSMSVKPLLELVDMEPPLSLTDPGKSKHVRRENPYGRISGRILCQPSASVSGFPSAGGLGFRTLA